MNAIEIQKQLIERISGITDIELLNSIKAILDFKKKEPFLYLTPEEEAELKGASKDVREGKFVYQSDMDQKVEVWLKES